MNSAPALHSIPKAVERHVHRAEEHGIDAGGGEYGDKIPYRAHGMCRSRAGNEKFLAERQPEKHANAIEHQYSAGQPECAAQRAAGVFKTDVAPFKFHRQEKTREYSERGVIIVAAAEKPAGNRHAKQQGVIGQAVGNPLFQTIHNENGGKSKEPAADHVGGIMHAETDSGKPAEQRNEEACGGKQPILLIDCHGGKEGNRIGGVSAGEGIPLCRKVVDIGFRSDGAKAFDGGMVAVGPAAQKDIFQHHY